MIISNVTSNVTSQFSFVQCITSSICIVLLNVKFNKKPLISVVEFCTDQGYMLVHLKYARQKKSLISVTNISTKQGYNVQYVPMLLHVFVSVQEGVRSYLLTIHYNVGSAVQLISST